MAMCCNETCKNTETVATCDICIQEYCKICSKISSTEERTVALKARRLRYYCPKCYEQMIKYEILAHNNHKLSSENKQLKEKIQNITTYNQRKEEERRVELPSTEPALVRSKHTICRVCTANGKLDEVIFTARKHGKVTYHCARASKWGDLLPVKLEFKETSDGDNIDKSEECTEK
ncbi:hypothetical protein NQ314_018165 [Rhamnusium bicolor]|uniref:RING-type domain-containing protein n=1 Tax=Rhamnusium bicolor TaxID=1586634 RepID=A0AAV8WQY1_9CUCU|nr:hypothetical protein NQ314_018165 [Rhamnusium bicolor]